MVHLDIRRIGINKVIEQQASKLQTPRPLTQAIITSEQLLKAGDTEVPLHLCNELSFHRGCQREANANVSCAARECSRVQGYVTTVG